MQSDLFEVSTVEPEAIPPSGLGKRNEPVVAEKAGGQEGAAPCVLGAAPGGLVHKPRDYQAAVKAEAMELLKKHRSVFVKMATGLGKGFIIADLATGWPGRVLALAHERELIKQLWRSISRHTTERVGVEKAQEYSYGARIVVGSVQSLKEHRLATLGEPPTLIIIDECHRATSKSYRKIIAAFPKAKVVGFSASVRADGQALGKVFEAHTRELDMLWGIEHGWLTPLYFQPVRAKVDLDAIGGDTELDRAALDDAVAAAAAEITAAVRDHAGNSRGLIFAPGRKTAHAAAMALNLKETGSCFAVDGETDDDERDRIVAGHKSGLFPWMSNCALFLEGYDDPMLKAVVDGAPCKSRTRLEQKVGRVTRLWPGIDQLPTAAERKAAIAASPKPYGIIYDLTGNGERVDLASPVDILGGTYTDTERAVAKRKLKETGGDPKKALEDARVAVRAAAARAAAMPVKTTVGGLVDPFRAFGVRDPERLRLVLPDDKPRPEDVASPKMKGYLRSAFGIEPPRDCTTKQARLLIAAAKKREQQGLCNYRQVAWLDRFGIDGRKLPRSVGAEIAAEYVTNGRRMPGPAVISRIISGGRVAGSEG
jgi:superfamily II DNA or RNA helicase